MIQKTAHMRNLIQKSEKVISWGKVITNSLRS